MEEKVFFKNSKGDRLCGLLTRPSEDGVTPVVIMAHGFSSNKNTKNFVALSSSLVDKNIATFRFDFYGGGESEGKFEDITISEGVDDILQAIHYVKTLGYTSIGLLGSSYGGICSIMAASQSSNLSFLVLKSPVSNFQEVYNYNKSPRELDNWKKNGYGFHKKADGTKLRVNYTFIEDFKNNDGWEVAGRITVPTFIVHGDDDTAVPISQSVKLAKLLPHSTLHIIKGADHRYTNPKDAEEMREMIVHFILQTSSQ